MPDYRGNYKHFMGIRFQVKIFVCYLSDIGLWIVFCIYLIFLYIFAKYILTIYSRDQKTLDEKEALKLSENLLFISTPNIKVDKQHSTASQVYCTRNTEIPFRHLSDLKNHNFWKFILCEAIYKTFTFL